LILFPPELVSPLSLHKDQTYFPKEDPHQDPNSSQDYQQLEQSQEALLGGKKEEGKMATNMNKASEVLQGPDLWGG
jgi:hypothetical protein